MPYCPWTGASGVLSGNKSYVTKSYVTKSGVTKGYSRSGVNRNFWLVLIKVVMPRAGQVLIDATCLSLMSCAAWVILYQSPVVGVISR